MNFNDHLEYNENVDTCIVWKLNDTNNVKNGKIPNSRAGNYFISSGRKIYTVRILNTKYNILNLVWNHFGKNIPVGDRVELINPTDSPRISNLRLKIKKDKIIRNSSISKGCESDSAFETRSKAAKLSGYEYLGRLKEHTSIRKDALCDYGIYRRLSCGHTRTLLHTNIDKGIVDCKDCIHDDYKLLCEKLGMQFKCFTRLRSNGTLYVDVVLSCGHSKQIQTGNLIRGVYSCQTCWFDKFKKDCINFDIKLIKQVSARTFNVELPCGCLSNKDIQGLRHGTWTCKLHKKSNLDSKSNLYLFKISSPRESWLKIGISANPELRSKQLSEYDYCIIDIIDVISFTSGHTAIKIEKALHKKYSKQRLPNEITKELMQSGFTECYPLSMLDIIIKEINLVKEINE